MIKSTVIAGENKAAIRGSMAWLHKWFTPVFPNDPRLEPLPPLHRVELLYRLPLEGAHTTVTLPPSWAQSLDWRRRYTFQEFLWMIMKCSDRFCRGLARLSTFLCWGGMLSGGTFWNAGVILSEQFLEANFTFPTIWLQHTEADSQLRWLADILVDNSVPIIL